MLPVRYTKRADPICLRLRHWGVVVHLFLQSEQDTGCHRKCPDTGVEHSISCRTGRRELNVNPFLQGANYEGHHKKGQSEQYNQRVVHGSSGVFRQHMHPHHFIRRHKQQKYSPADIRDNIIDLIRCDIGRRSPCAFKQINGRCGQTENSDHHGIYTTFSRREA